MINESILNEEVMKYNKNKTDHMKYLPDMEIIESDIMEKVMYAVQNYNYNHYTEYHVYRALEKEYCTPEDFGALLSPVALPLLEQIAQKARIVTRKHFGNSVTMFTPLYIANYCENYCIYWCRNIKAI